MYRSPPAFGEILPNGATVIASTPDHVLARTESGQFAVWSYVRRTRKCSAGHYFGQDLAAAVRRLENPYASPVRNEDDDGGEYAMLQGMTYGVEAYNEARGCGQSAHIPDCQHCLLPMDGSHAGCNC